MQSKVVVYPLSYYTLLDNDLDDEFGCDFVGPATGTQGFRVSHMFYADDLTLTANDTVQLQKMLRRLEWNAARNGLPVNVQEFYIVNFNAYRNSTVPVIPLQSGA